MLKIWGRPNSICTQRVLWGCEEAGLAYELTLASGTMGPKGHVSGGNAPYGIVDTPAYRAMNPNGTVPTIDDDGYVLWDSIAILGYLALRHAPSALHGGDIRVFAQAQQWMSWTNEHLEPALHVLVMELVRLPQAERTAGAVEAARGDMSRALARLEARLGQAPFVAGGDFSLGDIPTGAAVHRWRVFGLDGPALPNIDAWLARLGSREGFRRHVEPRQYHLA